MRNDSTRKYTGIQLKINSVACKLRANISYRRWYGGGGHGREERANYVGLHIVEHFYHIITKGGLGSKYAYSIVAKL